YQKGLANHLSAPAQLFEGSERTQGVDHLRTLARDFPRVAEYQSQLGTLFWRLGLKARDRGDPSHACRFLEQAVAHHLIVLPLAPHQPGFRPPLRDAYADLVLVQLRRGNHADAARAAAASPGIFPESWEERERAATFLAHCVVLAESDPRLGPEERDALVRGYEQQVRHWLGEWDQRSAGQPVALNDLAFFLATCPATQFRDADRAIRLAEQAVARVPSCGEFWNTLGVASYRGGHWIEAVRALTEAVNLRKGGDSSDWFFLPLAYS